MNGVVYLWDNELILCRQRVLKHLQEVVDKFCAHVGKLKGLPQSTIDTMSGKLFCFGSYALGVHGPSE
jgi:poly(A) polymerase